MMKNKMPLINGYKLFNNYAIKNISFNHGGENNGKYKRL